jgi:hypothetical protein
VKIVVTSMRRFLHNGRATPASHSWKWAITAFSFSWATNWELLARHTQLTRWTSYLSQEPCNEIAEDYGLVGFGISRRRGDGSSIPQIRLPLIHEFICGFCIDQQHSWSSLDQPAAVYYTNPPLLHGLDCGFELGVCWGKGLDLDGSLQLH